MLRKTLKLAFVLAALLLCCPDAVLACDGDENIRTARLALPADESLNIFDAGGLMVLAPGSCGGGIYALAYPALLKKAKVGDAKAMDHVGLMLSAGAGTKQDMKAAVTWLLKAAVGGSAESDYRLGVIYQFGLATDVDLPEAIRRYQTASGKSIAFASTNLGMMHFQGIGLPKNLIEAVRLFELAHVQGDHLATQNLASIYSQGIEGIPRDEARAFKLAGEAAQNKNIAAMRLLGFFHANGIGTAQDLSKAYTWSSLASDRGDVPATKLMSRIRQKLTDEQLAASVKVAETCVASDFKNCGF